MCAWACAYIGTAKPSLLHLTLIHCGIKKKRTNVLSEFLEKLFYAEDGS